VFKWENNSDSIIILQNGVYKITIGLIGLEIKRNFGLIFNNDENIMIDSRIDNHNLKSENINDNDIYNERGNVKFVEKYIACIENIKIKVIIFDDNYKIKANINTNRYECNFNIVEAFADESHNREVLKDLLINKDKLFKSIYVPIEGCPKWCQKEIKASQKESVKTYSK